MTRDDLAELEALLAAYNRALLSRHPTSIARGRKAFETCLVKHAEELIAAIKMWQLGRGA